MLLFSVLIATSTFFSPILAYPSYEKRADVASNITIPPPISNTALKLIPDAAHPYIAPGPGDQRGPCPGLNTLANHGYLPRNGIATFADITNAVQEGFNMDYGLGAAIAAYGMVTRGNPLINKLSIGGASSQIPPLPGSIDGTPGGLAKHGRFEGDVSFTRHDFALGDNRNFQQSLFDQLLLIQKISGDGQYITNDVLRQSKAARFAYSLAFNPKFEYYNVREVFSFGEGSFMQNFFSNGTEGKLSVPVMTSFFAKETFPPNWYRRNGAGNFTVVKDVGFAIAGPLPPIPGGKDKLGVFIPDLSVNMTDPCQLYRDLLSNVPAAIVSDKATPQVRANSMAMTNIIKLAVGQGCPTAVPSAPIG